MSEVWPTYCSPHNLQVQSCNENSVIGGRQLASALKETMSFECRAVTLGTMFASCLPNLPHNTKSHEPILSNFLTGNVPQSQL